MRLEKIIDSVVRIVGAVVVLIVVGLYARDAICSCLGDPPISKLTTNLRSIRAQLELYKLHHDGAYPADIVEGLTRKSNSDGVVSDTGRFGPYMREFPANPFVEDAAGAVKASGGSGEGWSYEPETGAFFANTYGHKDL